MSRAKARFPGPRSPSDVGAPTRPSLPSMAWPSASRTSSRPRTCRPARALPCGRDFIRAVTRLVCRPCARRARSFSARRRPRSSPRPSPSCRYATRTILRALRGDRAAGRPRRSAPASCRRRSGRRWSARPCGPRAIAAAWVSSPRSARSTAADPSITSARVASGSWRPPRRMPGRWRARSWRASGAIPDIRGCAGRARLRRRHHRAGWRCSRQPHGRRRALAHRQHSGRRASALPSLAPRSVTAAAIQASPRSRMRLPMQLR